MSNGNLYTAEAWGYNANADGDPTWHADWTLPAVQATYDYTDGTPNDWTVQRPESNGWEANQLNDTGTFPCFDDSQNRFAFPARPEQSVDVNTGAKNLAHYPHIWEADSYADTAQSPDHINAGRMPNSSTYTLGYSDSTMAQTSSDFYENSTDAYSTCGARWTQSAAEVLPDCSDLISENENFSALPLNKQVEKRETRKNTPAKARRYRYPEAQKGCKSREREKLNDHIDILESYEVRRAFDVRTQMLPVADREHMIRFLKSQKTATTEGNVNGTPIWTIQHASAETISSKYTPNEGAKFVLSNTQEALEHAIALRESARSIGAIHRRARESRAAEASSRRPGRSDSTATTEECKKTTKKPTHTSDDKRKLKRKHTRLTRERRHHLLSTLMKRRMHRMHDVDRVSIPKEDLDCMDDFTRFFVEREDGLGETNWTIEHTANIPSGYLCDYVANPGARCALTNDPEIVVHSIPMFANKRSISRQAQEASVVARDRVNARSSWVDVRTNRGMLLPES